MSELTVGMIKQFNQQVEELEAENKRLREGWLESHCEFLCESANERYHCPKTCKHHNKDCSDSYCKPVVDEVEGRWCYHD